MRPAASEILQFEGHVFEIHRRAFRRKMKLAVRPTGEARIFTSKLMPVYLIKNFILDHLDWIRETHARYQVLRSKYPAKKYEDGETFLFLGEARELLVLPAVTERVRCSLHEGHLVVWYPKYRERPDSRAVRGAMLAFYEVEGRRLLKERVGLWAEKTGLFPRSVSFRSQKGRWGSCSTRGSLSLNWKLIAAPLEIMDYVVVHELCHLRHPNHSPSFWELVARFVTDLPRKKRWLKDHHYELDFLSKQSDLHRPNS